jgi:hypothetical protein
MHDRGQTIWGLPLCSEGFAFLERELPYQGRRHGGFGVLVLFSLALAGFGCQLSEIATRVEAGLPGMDCL